MHFNTNSHKLKIDQKILSGNGQKWVWSAGACQSKKLYKICTYNYDNNEYLCFGISYFIQTFVNKTNKKLWNDWQVYLTNDFYHKVDQNKATLDSLLDHG